MQPLVRIESLRNLGVTIETLKDGFSAKLVTGRTARRAFEIFVRAGQRARRNLGSRGCRNK